MTAGPTYVNVNVEDGGHAYRVAFWVELRKPMICARKTKHGETLLKLAGPTARRIAALAATKLPK